MAYRCWTTTGMDFPAQFTWFLLVSYALPVFINHRTSILLHDLPGFFCFPTANQCLLITRINLPAGFIWSLSIWLRNSPGFFWLPMANRWLHFIRISVCLYDVPVWPWPFPAYKSRVVHVVAQFTWFLLVSYGLPVVTFHQKLGMPLIHRKPKETT